MCDTNNADFFTSSLVQMSSNDRSRGNQRHPSDSSNARPCFSTGGVGYSARSRGRKQGAALQAFTIPVVRISSPVIIQ
jgi:hypothetical protein